MPTTPQWMGGLDRVILVLATAFLGVLVNRKIITESDSALFLPVIIAAPAFLWGIYQNRQSAIVGKADALAKDPTSAVQGIVMTNTKEGRDLAAANSGTTVVAGTVGATNMVKDGV